MYILHVCTCNNSILLQAKPDSNRSDISEVLKKLRTHLSEAFEQDFLFYTLLAYRMHTMYSVYECDELRQFIPSCIHKLEAMDMKTIVRGILSFIER